MSNPVDDRGNVKVDFVWGNMPMQPDDARGVNTLDPALDNHIIATSGYEGFPGFITGAPYDDTVANVTVPNVVGLSEAAATTALTTAGLVKGAVTTTALTPKTVTHIAVVDSTDLVTITSTAHGFAVSDSIVFATATEGWSGFSGTYTITAKTNDTVTFSAPVAADNNGDITGTVYKASVVGSIASQNPTAGTIKNAGSSVALVKFVAP